MKKISIGEVISKKKKLHKEYIVFIISGYHAGKSFKTDKYMPNVKLIRDDGSKEEEYKSVFLGIANSIILYSEVESNDDGELTIEFLKKIITEYRKEYPRAE